MKEAVSMASRIEKKFNKYSTELSMTHRILIVTFFAVLLFLGVKGVYAYYFNTSNVSFIGSKIGDFDGMDADGDINMLIYKQNSSGKYIRTYAVPAMGYTFNSALTKCFSPVTKENITCSKDNSSADCNYSFNTETMAFTLNSKTVVTCKFYFDESMPSDIDVYIMGESKSSTDHSYNSKYYKNLDSVPIYGYEFTSYTCTNNATLTFDSNLRKFTVSASKPHTVCYAYFNSTGNADIIVNTYIEEKKGSGVFTQTNTIPANKSYTLNSRSSCDNGSTVTYENGYVLVDATSKDECNVYLNLAS